MPNCPPVSPTPRFAFTRARRLRVLLFVVPVLLGAGSAPGQSLTWTIPGIANAAGQNGTRFVSDVALTNPGASPASVTLTFFGPGGLPQRTISIPAGATTAYRNLLDSLWGAQGSGATQVASDLPLLIRARTYNTASSGTFGVALPVFADERMLELGETAESLWISQSPDTATGYRTNVAVVFPDEGGGSAAVTIYDANGTARGSKDYSLDAPGFQQLSVSSFAGAVPVGRAEVVVTRGRAAGYSIVNDNVTGDGSLFTFEDLPAGSQDILVNGVARIDGNFGTFFRTDGRFYNPGTADATMSVAFHASLNANPAPLTRTFTVPAGKILDVVDVLDSLLGLPKGSAGALRFRSDAPVAILCRTSNVDPAGIRPGTFGAQQKSVSLLSFLMSADAGAVVTGIRQNTTFRTNIGFAAGEDGAAYTLTLKSTSGATVATKADSLGPFGWKQPSIQVLFPGVPIPDDATLQVKVTSGSVDVFDSSLDNASGDSVVTPIMPLPVAIPSTATIGPAGGSIRSVDGALTLRIPAGALSAPVAIGLSQAANDAPGGVGPGYDISPDGLVFAKPALLSLRYGPGGMDVPEIGGLTLAVPSGASWAGLAGGRIDTGARTFTIGLPGTNLSHASSPPAGRMANATTGVARHVFLKGLELQTLRDWVITDGKEAHMLLLFRLPPSSTGGTGPYLMTDLNLDPSNIHFFQTDIGTVTSQSPDEFTYFAPHSIAHASIPVKLRARVHVTHGAGVPFGDYEMTKVLHVIRRRWSLRVEFALDLACVGSNEDYSYSYSDEEELRLHIEDDVTGLLLVKDPFLAGLPNDADVKACSCTPTSVGTPGTINFDGISGKFDHSARPPRFEITGKAVIPDMIPTVQYDCPSHLDPPSPPFFHFTDDPTTYDLNLEIFLLGFGGLRPADGNAKLILLEPPLFTYTVQWHSIAE